MTPPQERNKERRQNVPSASPAWSGALIAGGDAAEVEASPDDRSPPRPAAVARARLGWALNSACVLLSIHFSIAYATLTNPMVAFGPYKEMNGGGGAFAYRMLPAILWKISAQTLGPLHARIPWLYLPSLNKPFDSNEDWFVVVLTFLAMLGTLLVARRLLRAIDDRWGFEWIALGMGYAAYFDTILVLNRNLYYPYDILGLFFFTLLVYLAYIGRPVMFTAVLMIAMLNKETAIMSVLLYFGLHCTRQTWKKVAAVCCGMGVAATAVRLAQMVYVHHLCPACREMAQNQLMENLHQLPNPLFWLSELSVFGFGYVAVLLFWRYVPRRVQITAPVLYGLWALGMAVVGVLREVRIFSELSAVLLLVIGLGVHGWLDARPARLSQGCPRTE